MANCLCWWRIVASHLWVSAWKLVCARNGMVKGRLLLGGVRLRELKAWLIR